MPPAAGGSAPGPLTWKIMMPCWREAKRQQASLFSPSGVSKGSALCRRRRHSSSFCFLTFTQLSLVADDCKKLLVESMNAFLEPIRDRRKALTKTPSSSGTCSKPATPKPAPGPRGIWMRSRKAELYLLEKAGRCLWRPGAQPPDSRPENNDACWRAKPRANRRHCFPQAGFPKGLSPFGRRRHSSSLLLNVYATVACRRRLQKSSSSNP